MNIAVIAADGRLGREFVKIALKAGHSVRAGARKDASFEKNKNLLVVQCDATNISDLNNLIHGQDAVVSCIGHVKGSESDVQTQATKALVLVMDEQGQKRFVTVTGTGVRFPGDNISPVDRLLNLSIQLIDPARVKDGKDHMKVLQKSDLDWTVIRVLKLQNTKLHDFKLTINGPTKWYVGRAEVAQAMLRVIEEHSFIRESPIITSTFGK